MTRVTLHGRNHWQQSQGYKHVSDQSAVLVPDTRPYWPALRILAKQALCLALPIFAAWGLLIAFS